MIRTRLKSWLCASSLLSALVSTEMAHAAHSDLAAPTPLPSAPKAERPSVKLSSEKTWSAAPVPFRLELTSPQALPESRSFRHEIVWLGMRIPTLIAFGLSSVSAGGAVVTGFAAARGNDPSTCDHCAEHNVRRRALLVTTGVLAGMAATGVGIGVTFMLREPRDPQEEAVRPRFDLGVTGQKAVAKVGWVFSSF